MSLLLISPILLAMVIIVVGLRKRKRYLPLPPGPKGLPLIGNFFDMPSMYEWEKYMEWARQYGACRAQIIVQVLAAAMICAT